MNRRTMYELSQGVYYLFLGLWFGALVMLAIGAAVTFRTVRRYEVTLGLEPFNHEALAAEAPNILAGAITGNALRALGMVQVLCAVMVLGCLVAQATVFARYIAQSSVNWIRTLCVLVPSIIIVIDIAAISPRIWEYRRQMYDPQLSAEARAIHRQDFQYYHKLSERVVGAGALMLAGALVLSPLALSRKPDDQVPDERTTA